MVGNLRPNRVFRPDARCTFVGRTANQWTSIHT